MKTLRSIWLWTIGGCYFGGAAVFALICTFLFKPETYDPWLKAICRGLFRLLGIPVTVTGWEHLDPDRTMLYMANHVSIFDVPLLQGWVPQLIRGIEAEEQFRWPLWGTVIRRAGNIPINRTDVSKAIPSAKEAARWLHRGRSMVVLPEGHRTLDGNLRPFKKLPFHLAKEGGVPLVPVGISGLYTVKRKGCWHIVPAPVTIAFGKPIPADVVASLSVEELRGLVRREIAALIHSP